MTAAILLTFYRLIAASVAIGRRIYLNFDSLRLFPQLKNCDQENCFFSKFYNYAGNDNCMLLLPFLCLRNQKVRSRLKIAVILRWIDHFILSVCFLLALHFAIPIYSYRLIAVNIAQVAFTYSRKKKETILRSSNVLDWLGANRRMSLYRTNRDR